MTLVLPDRKKIWEERRHEKRIVSLLLVLCMIFTLVPAYALTGGGKTAGTAADRTQTAAPSGGLENPFTDVKSGD